MREGKDFRGRKLAQTLCNGRCCASAASGGTANATPLRFSERQGSQGRHRATLQDRVREKTLIKRRKNLGANVCGASRLTGNRYICRIAAKGRDIVMHPAQRKLIIEDAVIAE